MRMLLKLIVQATGSATPQHATIAMQAHAATATEPALKARLMSAPLQAECTLAMASIVLPLRVHNLPQAPVASASPVVSTT